MSKVYKKDPVPGSSDQKFTWKTVAVYDTFEGAKHDISTANLRGEQNLKIKRRKNTFDVRLGTPVKKKD